MQPNVGLVEELLLKGSGALNDLKTQAAKGVQAMGLVIRVWGLPSLKTK